MTYAIPQGPDLASSIANAELRWTPTAQVD